MNLIAAEFARLNITPEQFSDVPTKDLLMSKYFYNELENETRIHPDPFFRLNVTTKQQNKNTRTR